MGAGYNLARCLLRNARRSRLSTSPWRRCGRFREVFVLREMEELSYKEFADVARIPIGTVMSRLSARAASAAAAVACREQAGSRNCSDTKRLIDAYLDNELRFCAARWKSRRHVARCPGCGEEERALRELQASARAESDPVRAVAGIEARLREALHVENLPPVSPSSEPHAPRAARASPLRVEVGRRCAFAAAAALLSSRAALVARRRPRLQSPNAVSRRTSGRPRQPSHGCSLLRPAHVSPGSRKARLLGVGDGLGR